MRSRSPSRRSTPPPPRISRRSPGGFRPRGKSPDRRRRMAPPGMPPKYIPGGRGGGSPPRGRDRREFRHSPRRSRSPLHREPKARSFSPGKRKLSPKRERERTRERERERGSRPPGPPSRKRSRSKSPNDSMPGPSREGRLGSYSGNLGGPSEVSPPGRSYAGPSGPYPPGPGSDGGHSSRNLVSLSERFHVSSGPGSYKKEPAEHPVFRGPEGTGIDVNELKKITVDIRRNLPVDMVPIERSILNPDDVVLVRRPGEGSRPIFSRDEIIEATKVNTTTTQVDEHRRVVAIVDEGPPRGNSRFGSPGRYTSAPPRSRDSYYDSTEREPSRDYPRSSRDYDRHGPPPGFNHRERSREDRFDRRSEDLRHELELRRRDDSRYSSQGDSRRYEREYRGDSDRGSSDLRMRINEKRTDRHDDRSPSSHHRMIEHRPDPIDRDRERPHRGMMQPSPPGSERRRSHDGFVRSMPDGRMRDGGGGRIMHHAGPSRRDSGPDRFHQEPTGFTTSTPRPDRFQYRTWDSNPEHVPKGRGYFEHDNRDGDFIRGRGRGMMMQRGMGMRGRGMMRGRPFRGGGPTRMFMGRSGGRRGGYPPRGFFKMY